jgi:cytosine/adenosine deaminase-related metal-dependent hydrolase
MLGRPSRGGVTLVNADVGGAISSVRIRGTRIAGVGSGPVVGDRVVDLNGDRVLPGLINAHDHLQLNSFPPIAYPRRYRNAREWIADMAFRRRSDPALRTGLAAKRWARLLTGAIKNLLSGVTTVAHHDPLYPGLLQPGFPVRIVANCTWSHSLFVDGQARVQRSHRATPAGWPWIIHAAEGVDEEAHGELELLDSLGCLTDNTLIVHGVALDRAQLARLAGAGAGLIWCPGSNLRLFGRTSDVAALLDGDRVALGTDSRLSGERDLLAELRLARNLGLADDATLEALVTSNAARVLRLKNSGALRPGNRADLIVMPAGMPIATAARADLRLVVLNGTASYGDEAYAQQLAAEPHWVEVRVDGRRKALRRDFAMLLSEAGAAEPGLEMPATVWRAA